MSLDRLTSGLKERDHFLVDTKANYERIGQGSSAYWSVATASPGTFNYSNISTSDKQARKAQTGVKLTTIRVRLGNPFASGAGIYCYIAHATAACGVNNWAGYRVEWDPVTYWSIGKYLESGSSGDIGSSESTDQPEADTYLLVRIWQEADNHLYGRVGTLLGTLIDGGVNAEVVPNRMGFGCKNSLSSFDYVEGRSGHLLTVAGLPTGWKARASKTGYTSVTATESGGTATLDVSPLEFPLTTLDILTAADVLVESISAARYADMGGGDTYAYTPGTLAVAGAGSLAAVGSAATNPGIHVSGAGSLALAGVVSGLGSLAVAGAGEIEMLGASSGGPMPRPAVITYRAPAVTRYFTTKPRG